MAAEEHESGRSSTSAGVPPTGQSDQSFEEVFADVITHAEAVADIAGGSAADAYLFRIIQALDAGVEPHPEDVARLFEQEDAL